MVIHLRSGLGNAGWMAANVDWSSPVTAQMPADSAQPDAAPMPLRVAQVKKRAAQAQGGKKPNILVIFGDDIGVSNISAYHRGMMGGATPNIDRIAKEGLLFTDYYAQQSCTGGCPLNS